VRLKDITIRNCKPGDKPIRLFDEIGAGTQRERGARPKPRLPKPTCLSTKPFCIRQPEKYPQAYPQAPRKRTFYLARNAVYGARAYAPRLASCVTPRSPIDPLRTVEPSKADLERCAEGAAAARRTEGIARLRGASQARSVSRRSAPRRPHASPAAWRRRPSW
jgi:hypothetical protein